MDKKVDNSVCALDSCCGCMACVSSCPKDAINIVDSLKSYNAIKNSNCINCGLCEKICPQNNSVHSLKPIAWYQGWTQTDNDRSHSASGGYAFELSRAFLKKGGSVCGCTFENGIFGFSITNSTNDLFSYAGSKYVKSNPGGVYKDIKRRLSNGERVLFIGLPCQVAAVKAFVGKKLYEHLFTIDLICHGTPSPHLLELYFRHYGVSLKELSDIQFRIKAHYKDNFVQYSSFVPFGIDDSYSLAFLHGLTYTANCYCCQYAKVERVSDISLGDSWGTSLDSTEKKKGISLALVQTNKGLDLIDSANLVLKEVDLSTAVSNNSQLNSPTVKPLSRDRFFSLLEKGVSFDKSVFQTLKMESIRQIIKLLFIKLGLKRVSGINYRILYLKK